MPFHSLPGLLKGEQREVSSGKHLPNATNKAQELLDAGRTLNDAEMIELSNIIAGLPPDLEKKDTVTGESSYELIRCEGAGCAIRFKKKAGVLEIKDKNASYLIIRVNGGWFMRDGRTDNPDIERPTLRILQLVKRIAVSSTVQSALKSTQR